MDGVVIAMTGGSLAHATISTNLVIVLHDSLRGRPCRVFGSDARLRVPLFGNARYPDGSGVLSPG